MEANRLALMVGYVLSASALVGASSDRQFRHRCGAGDVACLVEAMEAAQTSGRQVTIQLDAGVYSLTSPAVDDPVVGRTGLPIVKGAVRIVGAGTGLTIIQRPSVASGFRLIAVEASGTLDVEQLTLRGGLGLLGSTTEAAEGGGLWNEGHVTLTAVVVTDNTSVYRAGAIWNAGEMTIVRSEISRGDGSFIAGGIYNLGVLRIVGSSVVENVAAGVSGIYNRNVMEIRDSTVSGNNSYNGPGAAIWSEGVADISNTTIADNEISGSWSGGILFNRGTMTVRNATIARNVIRDPAPGQAAVRNYGSLLMLSSTVADNFFSTAGEGGQAAAIENRGEMQLGASIVGRNPGLADCLGQGTSLGFNIIEDMTGCSIPLVPTDLTGDPGLDTDQGGLIPPLATSRAVELAELALCTVLDARGMPRVDADGDGVVACDAGAIEYVDHPVTIRLSIRRPSGQHAPHGPQGEPSGIVERGVRGRQRATIDVLGSATLDVEAIDETTARAGATGHDAGSIASRLIDVNDDGILDRRFVFLESQLGLTADSATVSFTAKTCGGATVAGTAALANDRGGA
jgi:hypothetical protein